MDFQGVDSVELPQAGNEKPFTKYLEYKPGKTPANFAGSATAEQVNAGFSYYDKEAATRVQLHNFRAIVVGQAMGAGGVTKDGARYINYYSNLVSNTKTDPIRVYMRGASTPVAQGLYQNIKADLPDGVGFKHYLIVYIPELNECAAMEITYGLQCCFQRVIASNATGRKVPYNRVNMFALLDMQHQYYMFTFNGSFYKASKEADRYESGECYFYPQVTVKMIVDDKQLEFLDAHSEAVTKWLESERDRVAGDMMSQTASRSSQQASQASQQAPQQASKQTPQRADDNFPDLEPLNEFADLPF